ncbi:hypothetical protein L0Y69_03085 [bacterium]|nr:hypothetical protein [bacterium]
MKTKPQKQHGFIALISVLIISVVILGLTSLVNMTGFFSRFNTLKTEQKRVSLSLAESCANTALLNIAVSNTYAPGASGDIVSVGGDTCVIKQVLYGAEDPITHRKTATITTEGEYHGTWSKVSVTASIQNPAFPSIPQSPNITIVSWQEIP